MMIFIFSEDLFHNEMICVERRTQKKKTKLVICLIFAFFFFRFNYMFSFVLSTNSSDTPKKVPDP